jgi:hypothetical protein
MVNKRGYPPPSQQLVLYTSVPHCPNGIVAQYHIRPYPARPATNQATTEHTGPSSTRARLPSLPKRPARERPDFQVHMHANPMSALAQSNRRSPPDRTTASGRLGRLGCERSPSRPEPSRRGVLECCNAKSLESVRCVHVTTSRGI